MSLLEIIKNLFSPKNTQELEQHIQESIDAFLEEKKRLSGKYISNQTAAHFSDKWGELYRQIKGIRFTKKNALSEIAQQFLSDYENLTSDISALNTSYFEREKERCRAFLDDIDGKSLDDQQRTAVVCDADRTLVIAGAGSGKTLTIAAKVKYLCEEKPIPPEDILLIAFTRKAADEMNERIRDGLSLNVTATTFHKLGLDILTQERGKRYEVVDALREFVTHYFEQSILDNAQALQDLIQYFAYYLKIPADLEEYESLGDAYEAERGADLESIRGKYQRSKYVSAQADERSMHTRSLRNEQMKSLEEVTIANFLFLNGVDYEYERLYPFEADDPTRKAYRPDFYLPDYDLYLEHFGINREGRVPWLTPVEEQKYLEGIQWKRDFHQKNGTTLLETYSYYASEGRLLEELERILKERNVGFQEPDFADIFRTIYDSKSEKYLSEFIKLCCTFLILFKSQGGKPEDLPNLQPSKTLKQKPFHSNRTRLFLRIISPLLEAYETMLAEREAVDFSDMINRAAALVEGGYQVHPYQWVIVDEYQDISMARYKLVKAILKQTGAKLLCVGDDWQSIYRFAGSDISLFTRFEEYFGSAEILPLERTYRNSQQLIDEAGSFVMRNPAQYTKHLRSDKSLDYPIVFMYYQENPQAKLKQAMDKCIQERGENASIMLLGRTNYDIELLRATGLFKIKNTGTISYVNSPHTPVFFLTVHRSKGLEAENVILLNFQNDTLGFPNQISDDPLLNLVLTRGENYPYAEERRLLYVALTRTRNRIYILVDKDRPSVFLKEFDSSKSVFKQIPKGEAKPIYCPRCKTGHLTMRKNENNRQFFVGCSNYPRCDYTVADPSVLANPKRCPQCGGFLLRRRGQWGTFYGCSNYPQCTYKEKESG